MKLFSAQRIFSAMGGFLYRYSTFVLVFICLFCIVLIAANSYFLGFDKAQMQGELKLTQLQRAHAQAVAKAHELARAQLEREVARANIAESQLYAAQHQHEREKSALLKRIRHATTSYIPSGTTTLVPLPASLFTIGFVRQYNAALGLSAVNACAIASPASAATPASDAAHRRLCAEPSHHSATQLATRGTSPQANSAAALNSGLNTDDYAANIAERDTAKTARLLQKSAYLYTDDELALSGLTQADILAHIADYGLRCRNLEAQVLQLQHLYVQPSTRDAVANANDKNLSGANDGHH